MANLAVAGRTRRSMSIRRGSRRQLENRSREWAPASAKQLTELAENEETKTSAPSIHHSSFGRPPSRDRDPGCDHPCICPLPQSRVNGRHRLPSRFRYFIPLTPPPHDTPCPVCRPRAAQRAEILNRGTIFSRRILHARQIANQGGRGLHSVGGQQQSLGNKHYPPRDADSWAMALMGLRVLSRAEQCPCRNAARCRREALELILAMNAPGLMRYLPRYM
jgi:hypothetical protein